MNYDLEERTAKFGEVIIKFCKTIQNNNIRSGPQVMAGSA